ncbi:hypothetical protein PG994_012046 [Apiospora phragmitis]|uniref:F-box domain-containing protein n=1 Tax=Apiospora phragmitis TaxID=2905665 RepID=A0ABR1TWT4_9PEZI
MLHLPTEILSAICCELPNREIKNLRLACSLLKAIARLRLERVFLSANCRNLNVFKAIADHGDGVFRNQVVEIVWDDTILPEDDTQDGESDIGEIEYGDTNFWEDGVKEEQADRDEQKFSGWFSGAHIRAYEDAWVRRRFPALRTITITPAAHGRLFHPLFETPMIRAFPPGFIYNVPRGWPVLGLTPPEAEEWDEDGSDWPAFRTVTSVLARYPHHPLPELRVDAFEIPTGLNVRVFEEPCRALTDFTALVARPSFQRLHLDLLVGAQEHLGWPAFTRGQLAAALSAAKLQSLSIQTNVQSFMDRMEPYCVSLRTIFTPASLASVRHFSLGGFYIREDDLMQILADLPQEFLQTVEFKNLYFVPKEAEDDVNSKSFWHLIERMRDELQWRNVKLTIGVPPGWKMVGQTLWVDVDEFLYRGGDNPFYHRNLMPDLLPGFGTLKDVFDVSNERPNVDRATEKTMEPIQQLMGTLSVITFSPNLFDHCC